MYGEVITYLKLSGQCTYNNHAHTYETSVCMCIRSVLEYYLFTVPLADNNVQLKIPFFPLADEVGELLLNGTYKYVMMLTSTGTLATCT